jgi:hypothetical protein
LGVDIVFTAGLVLEECEGEGRVGCLMRERFWRDKAGQFLYPLEEEFEWCWKTSAGRPAPPWPWPPGRPHNKQRMLARLKHRTLDKKPSGQHRGPADSIGSMWGTRAIPISVGGSYRPYGTYGC